MAGRCAGLPATSTQRRGMLCKVLRKERVGGFRMEPGQVVDLPRWVVDAAGEAVQVIEQEKQTNLDLTHKLSGMAKGGRVLVKLPEVE